MISIHINWYSVGGYYLGVIPVDDLCLKKIAPSVLKKIVLRDGIFYIVDIVWGIYLTLVFIRP